MRAILCDPVGERAAKLSRGVGNVLPRVNGISRGMLHERHIFHGADFCFPLSIGPL